MHSACRANVISIIFGACLVHVAGRAQLQPGFVFTGRTRHSVINRCGVVYGIDSVFSCSCWSLVFFHAADHEHVTCGYVCVCVCVRVNFPSGPST